MRGGEPLPLDGAHAVPLQVAEAAIVPEHVKAVDDPLEGAARSVPAVDALPDVGTQDLGALLRRPRAHLRLELLLGVGDVRQQHGDDQRDLRVDRVARPPVDERDGRVGRVDGTDDVTCCERAGVLAGGREVVAPHATTVRTIDPRDERRDDLPQLVQQPTAEVARLALSRLSRGERQAIDTVVPLYLRKTEAERKLERGLS